MANLNEALKKAEHLRSGDAASDIDIKDAENQLGLSFASEYKEYLKAYGVVSFSGHELIGISKSPRLNVVNVTKEAREIYKHLSDGMYVVEDTGYEGILILQDQKGTVYKIEPNSKPSKIYSSLTAYIKG